MRIIDSPELFGVGCGCGTSGPITCGICKKSYYEGAEEIDMYNNPTIQHTDFAGLTVCDCCFEVIENEILSRMPAILKWYRKYIDNLKANIKSVDTNLQAIEAICHPQKE